MSDPGMTVCRRDQRKISRQLVMQPALVDFAVFPSRHLHPSWRTTLFGYPLGDAVWCVPSAHRHLSAHLRRALNLPDIATQDFESPSWAIATLSSEQLDRLVRHVGAVALQAEIRGAIDRNSIHAIIDQAGRQLYEFTLQRARLLCPMPVSAADLLGVPVDFNAIGVQLQQAGRRMTQQYLDQCDPALWARAQLKLAFMPEQTRHASATRTADALVSRIVLNVKREMQ